MSEITRHFTATTFIVHGGRVLLHCHPKQGLYLPPGGHIERDELPHEAAIREIEEETGLRLRLHSEADAEELGRMMECPVVPQPAFILVEEINPFHQHIDFTYFARIEDDGALKGAPWEQQGFGWYAPEELTMEGVPRNVIEGAKRAIGYFQSSRSGH